MSGMKRGIAFFASIAVICGGFAVLSHNNAEIDAAYADDVMYLTDDPNAPEVYMTTAIDADALVRIYDRLGFEPTGNVAVKMSTGEPPASNYLRPELIGKLVQQVDGTIVECNTAYGGSRASTEMHKQVIEDHGLNAISKNGVADIMDEDGSKVIPVPTPGTGVASTITENYVGNHIEKYNSLISLAHFKGHAIAGYGGAIKNMSIGMASTEGKNLIHTSGNSHTSWMQGGTQDSFLESMGDATSSVVNFFDGRVVYINVMNNLSVDCDCSGYPSAPQIDDIGILASYDPVALDQACIDLVREHNGTALINRINQRNGLHALEHAEEIGLGSREYRLVDIDREIHMTYEGGTLTIHGMEDFGNTRLLHASYVEGRLSGLEFLTAMQSQTVSANAGDKFFLWDNDLRPLCDVETVS